MSLSYYGTPVISESEAVGLSLQPMTTPYHVPGEDWMLRNVIADMECGEIKFALVQVGLGIEVWR